MAKKIVISEDYIDITNRQKMYYRYFIPQAPKGAVMMIHGYSEHSGRYIDVLEYFAERGFAVAAPDVLGHGRSAKRLGDLKSFRLAVEAIAALIFNLQDDYALPPFFVIGHSMGGCMGLAMSGLYPEIVKGIIVLASLILVPDYVSLFLKFMTKLLAAFLPVLPVRRIDFRQATINEERKEAMRQDPLCYHGRMRARTGQQFLEGIELAQSMLKNILAPSLIVHGSKDVIMPMKGSEFIFSELKISDKTLKVYKGWHHLLLSEPNASQLLKLIVNWINERNK